MMIPIEKIEFHEKNSPNLIVPYIETQFFVNNRNIIAFIEWCDEDKKVSDYAYMCLKNKIVQMSAWKRKAPKFDFHFKGRTLIIYPKQGIVAVTECRLHYVCQHSFDIFPRDAKTAIYDCYGKGNGIELGILFPRKTDEKLIVYTGDILAGFLLHSEKEKSFDSDFVKWIRHRENQRIPR